MHGVVRRPPSDDLVRAITPVCAPHYHDGSTESLAGIVALVRPAVVFHLATRFVSEHSAPDVAPLVRDNIQFGTQLLEAMRGAEVKRIVNAGSAWQHFRNAEYSPVSLYAATKKAFADILEFFVEAAGVQATTLEFTDTYGPGDTRRKLIPIMREAERIKRELSMVSGDLPLNLLHVDDAVDALIVAARRLADERSQTHSVYAVRSREPVTLKELFAIWERARGARLAARWGERPVRAREVLDQWTQGNLLPGWNPKVSLLEGLRGL